MRGWSVVALTVFAGVLAILAPHFIEVRSSKTSQLAASAAGGVKETCDPGETVMIIVDANGKATDSTICNLPANTCKVIISSPNGGGTANYCCHKGGGCTCTPGAPGVCQPVKDALGRDVQPACKKSGSTPNGVSKNMAIRESQVAGAVLGASSDIGCDIGAALGKFMSKGSSSGTPGTGTGTTGNTGSTQTTPAPSTSPAPQQPTSGFGGQTEQQVGQSSKVQPATPSPASPSTNAASPGTASAGSVSDQTTNQYSTSQPVLTETQKPTVAQPAAPAPVSVAPKTSPTSISTTQIASNKAGSFTSQFSRASFTAGNTIKSSVSGSGNTGFGSGTSALFSFVSSFVSGFVSSAVQSAVSTIQPTSSSSRKPVVVMVQSQQRAASSTYVVVSPAPSVLNIVTGEAGSSSGRGGLSDLALLDRAVGIEQRGGVAVLSPLSLYDQAPVLTDAAAAHTERSVGVIPTPAARNIFTDATLVSSSTLADAIAQHATQLNAPFVVRASPQNGEAIDTTLAASEGGHAISVVDLISAIMTGSIAKVRAALGLGRVVTSVALEGPATDRVPLPLDARKGKDAFDRAAGDGASSTGNDMAARAAGQSVSGSPVLSLPAPSWNPVRALSAIAPALQPYVPAPSFVPVFTSVPSSAASSESSPHAVSESTYPADTLSAETAAEVTPNPVGVFFGQIGVMFRQLFGWFFGGVVEENSTAVAREGDVSVRFIADPPQAVRGTQTTLYWTSSGADDCVVFTQDGNVFAHGPEGFALTPSLADGTQFFITCSSGETVVRAAVFVGVQ